MTDSVRPITLAQVAERLGRTRSWMYRHTARLRRDHRFPKPVPGLGGLYDPLAIDEWLAYWRTQQPAAAVTAEAASVSASTIEQDWAAILDARAATLSKGSRA